VLGNFPLSPRLQTLLLARNRIGSIQSSLAQSIPNLSTLVLTANNIAELADLDVLSTFPKLTHLVLMENPVTRKEVWHSQDWPWLEIYSVTNSTIILKHYRLWVLWRCPAVRFLDYQKVKDAERKKAKELFGTAAEPSALASKVCNLAWLRSNGRLEAHNLFRLWVSSRGPSMCPRRMEASCPQTKTTA
jgi:U2 small nuclear ribonucleoprotein A'